MDIPNKSSAWYRGVSDGMIEVFPNCPYSTLQQVGDWNLGWAEGQMLKIKEKAQKQAGHSISYPPKTTTKF